jgi:hypothetical protein
MAHPERPTGRSILMPALSPRLCSGIGSGGGETWLIFLFSDLEALSSGWPPAMIAAML